MIQKMVSPNRFFFQKTLCSPLPQWGLKGECPHTCAQGVGVVFGFIVVLPTSAQFFNRNELISSWPEPLPVSIFASYHFYSYSWWNLNWLKILSSQFLEIRSLLKTWLNNAGSKYSLKKIEIMLFRYYYARAQPNLEWWKSVPDWESIARVILIFFFIFMLLVS